MGFAHVDSVAWELASLLLSKRFSCKGENGKHKDKSVYDRFSMNRKKNINREFASRSDWHEATVPVQRFSRGGQYLELSRNNWSQ